jgi:octaprenyl-diphosphate synthase
VTTPSRPSPSDQSASDLAGNDAGRGALDAIIAPVVEELRQVERVLREGVRSVAPAISQIGDHVFSGGGKRLRPALVLLSSRMCGYRGPRAIQIAAAAENLHTATLIHDDVVDGASLRRGRLSANAQFGPKLSVLVGDFLYAICCQTLVEDGSPDVLAIFAESIRSMAEGEVLQLSRSFDLDLTEASYFQVIERKTGTLIAACTEAGAILGGVTRAERRALREYGREIGLAFQLVDDALDYLGSGSELGKAPLADAAEGKITLPLITTLKRCSVAERERLASALKTCAASARGSSSPELAWIASCVETYHGVDATLARAAGHAAAARAHVEPFVDCEAKRSLLDLADFTVQRRS